MHDFSRRQFSASLIAAGVAGLMPSGQAAAAGAPPEVTTIRLQKTTTICFAPLYVIESFLRAEGFTDIQYVGSAGGYSVAQRVANGDIDIGTSFGGTVVHHLDSGWPITAIGGLHVGCYELFAREPITSIRDLKGRRVGIQTFASSAHLYLSIMAAHIGIDPQKDIEWVTNEDGNPLESFVAGKTEVYLGFPPEPQELRSRGFNRVILNTIQDRPWSQYICCMMYGNARWVRDNPIATKRYLRAIYRAAEFCTANPENVARQLVDRGFTKNYDFALQTVQEITYDQWHDFDSADAMRFYALRLHDAGLLKNNPNTLLENGTNWTFLNELRREMKS